MKMVIDILDLVQKDISDSTNQIEKLQTDLVNIQKENEKEKQKLKSSITEKEFISLYSQLEKTNDINGICEIFDEITEKRKSNYEIPSN